MSDMTPAQQSKLAELPALWGVHWCRQWIDEASVFTSRRDAHDWLHEKDDDETVMGSRDGKVIPLTLAAMIEDEKETR